MHRQRSEEVGWDEALQDVTWLCVAWWDIALCCVPWHGTVGRAPCMPQRGTHGARSMAWCVMCSPTASCRTPHRNPVIASSVVAASKQHNIYKLSVWQRTSVSGSTRSLAHHTHLPGLPLHLIAPRHSWPPLPAARVRLAAATEAVRPHERASSSRCLPCPRRLHDSLVCWTEMHGTASTHARNRGTTKDRSARHAPLPSPPPPDPSSLSHVRLSAPISPESFTLA